MNVGDIVQVRFYTSFGDQTAINVRQYRVTAKSGSGATEAQVATQLGAVFGPLYVACINGGATFRGCDVQVIHPTLGVPSISSTGASAGATAGDPLPKQISALITVSTGQGGRKNRGRIYVPFWTEVDNGSTGQLNAGAHTTLASLATAFEAARPGMGGGGNTNDLIPVIWHRSTKTTTDVTLCVAQYNWATQRRRGAYGRPNPVPAGL